MKKALKIIAIILLVLIVICVALVAWQWPMISAILTAKTTSSADLKDKLTANDDKTAQAVESYVGEELRPFTEEEQEKIESGDTTKMQVIAQIIAEEMTEPSKPITVAPTPSPKPTPKPNTTVDVPAPTPTPIPTKTAGTLVKEAVATLSGYQDSFTGSIEAVVSSAIDEYTAILVKKHLPTDPESRSVIIGEMSSKIASLESSCDSKVNTLLSNLETNLKAIGAETEIVGTLRSAYSEQKALKRAYYLNEYLN